MIGPDFAGVVISDIRMPGMDGMALLRRLQSIDPGLPVILMTGHGDVPMAVEAMRIGAFDFVEKPFEPDRLADLCQRGGEARARTLETRALRRELSDGSVVMRRLMGASPAIEKLRETILDVAQADGHVLVLGETGTGKSLIALALHACGPRAAKPLVTLNCASVAPELRRADALRRPRLAGEAADRPGRGRHALPRGHRGAVARGAGAAARRDQRQRHRPAARRAHNIRIVAVSSRLGPGTPPPEVLRDDLYFRLAGLVLEAPPLRARGEDILTLFSHFTIQFAEEYGCEPPTLGAGDAANLVQAPWPGNIRQLINLAERAVLQARRGDNNISALLIDDGFQAPAFPLDAEKPLKEHVDAFEKMLIDHALRRNQGSVSAVMTELALPRRTLNEKMAKYGLSRQDYL